MDAMQKGAIAQLPESPEPITTTEPEPTPEPQSPTDDVITVEVTPDPEPTTPTTPDPMTKAQNGKVPQSVGSAAFNTKDATLEELKGYVRSHQTDDKTKAHGKLSQRSTWVLAAKTILNISDYTK